MHSVFCPECQGTGILIDNDDLEKPNLPLSQLFKYKIKPPLSLPPLRPPPAEPSVTSSSYLTLYPLQTTTDLIPSVLQLFSFCFLSLPFAVCEAETTYKAQKQQRVKNWRIVSDGKIPLKPRQSNLGSLNHCHPRAFPRADDMPE
ncbi:hypothetical protein C1H46_020672 [Malus baccata]|uniref:Uncharacterized protein n=1 Tax=Malus baccata TaxID=106549 RepID=A0A540M4P0_MALBA|nr:hypothetical protein C1H46_020672 [Malus baccata]